MRGYFLPISFSRDHKSSFSGSLFKLCVVSNSLAFERNSFMRRKRLLLRGDRTENGSEFSSQGPWIKRVGDDRRGCWLLPKAETLDKVHT